LTDRQILLGVVGRPHGVRGLLHVHSYTADPQDLAGYGPLLDEQGRRWTLSWRQAGVAELRDAEGRPVADRTAAERLTNTRLFIERDRLPQPAEDEFYLSDLVGLRAVDPAGVEIGRVAVVHDYGAGVSLEIARTGPALLVPFTRASVPQVDVRGGAVTVVAPDEIEVPPEAMPEAMQDHAEEARA
jgi:16S rRNA processing protein RimM